MDTQVKRINRDLMIGWLVIVGILAVSYIGEVIKGERDIPYLLIFLSITVFPEIIAWIFYRKRPDDPSLRYLCVIGYSIMYIFVLFTGNTFLVFTYVLPMLALVVLYHDPKLILLSGIGTLVLNGAALYVWHMRGMLEPAKNHEIQMAVVFVCFLAAFFAARIYRDINGMNESYTMALSDKNEQMSRMTMQTIMTIANTIDAKDEYTRGHSRRVAEYAAAIAKDLGYPEEKIADIRFVGLLHDIGKIGVPDAVLNKPGRLTDEEYQLMKDHTITGGEILKDITMIDELDIGARYHHERYDGTGYPEGLKGDEIPEIARIIGVADAYDAMTSNRVYRRHLDHERVMNELRKGSGSQFDPRACDALIRLVENGRLPKVNTEEDSNEVKQTTKILSRVIDKAEDRAVDELNLDELTGAFAKGPGRSLIQESIGEHGKGSLYIFDIDGFRKINETEGYAVGDRYLKAAADLIRQIAGQNVVSRFGADEFIVYLPEVVTAEEAENVADYFITEVRERAAEDPQLSKLSVCIGITQIATEKDKVMVAYENAARALYVAKQCGTGSYFCHRLEGDDEDVAVAESVDLKQLIDAVKRKEEFKDGFEAAFPGFGTIYDRVSAFADEYGNRVHVILFTLVDTTGDIPSEEREHIVGLMKKSIQNVLRPGDESLRFSGVQRLVMLSDLTEHEVRQTINKIMTEFYRMYDRRELEVHYDSADLRRE